MVAGRLIIHNMMATCGAIAQKFHIYLPLFPLYPVSYTDQQLKLSCQLVALNT